MTKLTPPRLLVEPHVSPQFVPASNKPLTEKPSLSHSTKMKPPLVVPLSPFSTSTITHSEPSGSSFLWIPTMKPKSSFSLKATLFPPPRLSPPLVSHLASKLLKPILHFFLLVSTPSLLNSTEQEFRTSWSQRQFHHRQSQDSSGIMSFETAYMEKEEKEHTSRC